MVAELRDIVWELRNWEGEYHYPSGLLLRAADQIEQLRAEVRILSDTVMRLTVELERGDHEKEERQALLRQLREDLRHVALVGPDYRAAITTLDKLDEMV